MRSGILMALTIVLLGGCRPASDALVDSGRVVLRHWAGVELATVEVQETTLAYFERPAAGPTIVLLHGFATEKGTWLRFLREIPRDYRIIALDLPDHGSSSRDPDFVYTIDAMVQLVESAIAKLTQEPVHVVGTSLGGMIATLYTSRNLARVSTLTLFAPAGVYPPNPSEFQLALERGENPLISHTPEQFDDLVDIVFFDPPPMMWPVGAALRNYALARADFHEKIWNDLWPDHPTLNEYLPAIDIPVLLVWGEDDRVLDVSSVSVFERLLPQVETLRVEGLGHASANEQPAEMGRVQREFLQRHAN